MARRPSVAEWTRIGRDLRRLDPERFDQLLNVSRQVVAIHADLLERFPQPAPVLPASIVASRRWGVSTVVLLVVALLCGCELYTGDDDRPELDAGASVDARPIPDWREAECIALCAPDVGACGPADECQRSCERAVGAGLPSYCPGGESWRTWECKRLCSSSPGLCPGADQPTCQTECEAWQTDGSYCGAGAP